MRQLQGHRGTHGQRKIKHTKYDMDYIYQGVCDSYIVRIRQMPEIKTVSKGDVMGQKLTAQWLRELF